jgi:putative acetyltransferase
LVEFGANHPGTVFYDPSTDHLTELFNQPKASYLIAEIDGKIVGGGGIFPTPGLPEDVCEFVKFYLLPEGRGIGLGKKILTQCLEKAKEFGFKKVYLETMPELTIAIPMYEKMGFHLLDGPMGNSGHFGCAIQMLKTL